MIPPPPLEKLQSLKERARQHKFSAGPKRRGIYGFGTQGRRISEFGTYGEQWSKGLARCALTCRALDGHSYGGWGWGALKT